jgi:hypothetical protein
VSEVRGLSGVGAGGRLRGLLHFEVPFSDVDAHRAGEERFMPAVDVDPLLSRVPLVFVFAPERG